VLDLLPDESIPTISTEYIAPGTVPAARVSVTVLACPLPIPIVAGDTVATTKIECDLVVNVTVPLWLPAVSAVIAVVALPPGATVNVCGVAANVNPAVTLAVTCAVAVFPLPSVPVSVIVYSSLGASAAVIVNTSVSLLGNVTDDVASVAVTPLVTVVPALFVIDATARLTLPVNVPSGVTVTVSCNGALPAGAVTSVCAGVKVKLPVCTVSSTTALEVFNPESVPVILTTYVPGAVVDGIVTVPVPELPMATAAPKETAGPVIVVPYPSVTTPVRVTLPVSLPAAATAIFSGALPPGAMHNAAGVGVRANPALTNTVTSAVEVLPLLSVPVIVIEYSPLNVEAGGNTFKVSVSLAGTVMPVELGASEEAKAAQPVGLIAGLPVGPVMDEMVKVTAPVKLPTGETTMSDDAAGPPADASKQFDSAVTVKLPVCTVACTEQDVSLPFGSVPTMVTMAVPAFVPAGAVSVRIVVGLAAETVFEPSFAVTVAPVTVSGETVAASVTPAVNPSSGESEIVLVVPLATPIGTVTVSGFAFSQKLA